MGSTPCWFSNGASSAWSDSARGASSSSAARCASSTRVDVQRRLRGTSVKPPVASDSNSACASAVQLHALAAGNARVRRLAEERVSEAPARRVTRRHLEHAGARRFVDQIQRGLSRQVRDLGRRGERELTAEHRGGGDQRGGGR